MTYDLINKKQLLHLKRAVNSSSIAHAYLFSGPEGVGKLDAALDFFQLVNGAADRKKIMQGANPDCIVVKPEIEQKNSKTRKKEISIKQIKKASSKIGYFPYQMKYKALLILEAEKMNRIAANSLLKLIEEPAADTIVILVSNNEHRILPTIKSRCQMKRFGLAEEDILLRELRLIYSKVSPELLDSAVRLARGRITFAINYVENPEIAIEFEKQIEQFRSVLRGGAFQGFQFSESIANDREKTLELMNEWTWYMRDFARKRIANGEDARVVRKIFSILKSLVELRYRVESTNVNLRIQLDNFFAQIN